MIVVASYLQLLIDRVHAYKEDMEFTDQNAELSDSEKYDDLGIESLLDMLSEVIGYLERVEELNQ